MEDFRELGRRLSNWGRWDADGRRDERGTTNLLTPERIAAAAGLVRDGKVFDLGIPFGPGGPQPGTCPSSTRPRASRDAVCWPTSRATATSTGWPRAR